MKPLDLSKFRKNVTKAMGIVDGYHDPQTWVDTGNYAINKLISGSFFKGVPLGKVTVLAGRSGSGKSLLACGNIVKNCQKEGILPIILDSEFAIDEAWLHRAGVDTSPDKLMRFPVTLVDDCASMVMEFMSLYTAEYADVPPEDRQKVMFIIDSVGMLSTPTEVSQFSEGQMKGDMGRKAKQLKAFVTQCLKMFGPHNVGLIATNHVYQSQNQFDPEDVVSGGSGFIFASSIILLMDKLKLKKDENGNKVTEVRGIRAKLKCIKSRYARTFAELEIPIPMDTGIMPYAGLFDMLESRSIVSKSGNRYKFICKDGTEILKYRKDYLPEDFDRIMMETDDSDLDDEEGIGSELEELAEVIPE